MGKRLDEFYEKVSENYEDYVSRDIEFHDKQEIVSPDRLETAADLPNAEDFKRSGSNINTPVNANSQEELKDAVKVIKPPMRILVNVVQTNSLRQLELLQGMNPSILN